MLYIFITTILLMIIVVTGKLNLSLKFSRQVKKLLQGSTDQPELLFNKTQLKGLPDPVQRYFRLVLKDGQPYIRCARIKHDGLFRTGIKKKWIKITGEQYAATEQPGFIWKGKTAFFTARDMYLFTRGRLIVTLLSLYNIVDQQGEKYNEGELLRWLGESVLYPTNLLPSEALEWIPVDGSCAMLKYNYNGLALQFKVVFNKVGEITGLETKRFMGDANVETWVIEAGNYKGFDKVMIPTTFEVTWRLAQGDFSYARFNITEVEYNIARQF